jgi:LacI family transcriptional regulator
LKDHPDISPDTKRQVNELATKLRYKPNAIALSLKNRRSNVVGVIIPEIVHFFFSSVISGIQDVASKNGYNIMVSQTNENYDNEVAAVNAFMDGRIDGLLVSVGKETSDYDHFRKLEEEGIPIVFFDRIIEDYESDYVVIDDFGGAYSAVEHLIKTGKRRIAHFSGPQNRLIGKNRFNGYKQALDDYGIELDEELIISADNFYTGIHGINLLVDQGTVFDAVFTVNDFTAIGVIKTLKARGYQVPEQVAVVGFGDEDIAHMFDPMLTTVSQPGDVMGRRSMELLMRKLKTDNWIDHETIVLSTNLVIRNSTVPIY